MRRRRLAATLRPLLPDRSIHCRCCRSRTTARNAVELQIIATMSCELYNCTEIREAELAVQRERTTLHLQLNSLITLCSLSVFVIAVYCLSVCQSLTFPIANPVSGSIVEEESAWLNRELQTPHRSSSFQQIRSPQQLSLFSGKIGSRLLCTREQGPHLSIMFIGICNQKLRNIWYQETSWRITI